MTLAPRRLQKLLACLVTVVAAVAASACQARATVEIAIESDGSGMVTVGVDLDADAAAELAPIDAAFATEDLVAAGWSIEGPSTQPDGGVRIAASKPFANPDELPVVIAEASGPTGPLRDVRLLHENGFASSSLEVDGRVSLTGSLDQFSDPEVAGFLDGFALGRPPEEIAALLADNPDALRLDVSVSLPESPKVDGALVERDGVASGSWSLGSEAVDEAFVARVEDNNRWVVLWLALAALAVVAGGVLVGAGIRASRRSAGAERARPSRCSQRSD